MRKRQVFGWGILIFGIIVLLFSLLHNYHVYLGPLQFIYEIFDWFSFSAFMDLLWESFESVFDFIGEYFWPLFLIIIGIVLIFGAKRQKKYEEGLYSDFQEDNPTKRPLCRNLDDMKFAGVCSGFAMAMHVDPTIIRIVVLFLGFSIGFPLLLFYIILALLLRGEHLGHRY